MPFLKHEDDEEPAFWLKLIHATLSEQRATLEDGVDRKLERIASSLEQIADSLQKIEAN